MKTATVGRKLGLAVAGGFLAASVGAHGGAYSLSYTNSTDTAFSDMAQQVFTHDVNLQLQELNTSGITLSSIPATVNDWKTGSLGVENGESCVNRLKAIPSNGAIQGQDNTATFHFNNTMAFDDDSSAVAMPGNEYLRVKPIYDPSAHSPQDVANTISNGSGAHFVELGVLGAPNPDSGKILSDLEAYTGTGYIDFTGTGCAGQGQTNELTTDGGVIDIVTLTHDMMPKYGTLGFAAVSCIGLYYRRRIRKFHTAD